MKYRQFSPWHFSDTHHDRQPGLLLSALREQKLHCDMHNPFHSFTLHHRLQLSKANFYIVLQISTEGKSLPKDLLYLFYKNPGHAIKLLSLRERLRARNSVQDVHIVP